MGMKVFLSRDSQDWGDAVEWLVDHAGPQKQLINRREVKVWNYSILPNGIEFFILDAKLAMIFKMRFV
jgi:hypothetical protein